MPILTPLCIAAGPGNTVYAFASALTDGNSGQLPSGQYYVIAESNANPASFTAMTWSTVAAISSSAFGMLAKVVTCVVSDQGVVTVFGYTTDSYMVIRYDPSATPNGGTISTGPGGWIQIAVSNTYTLDSYYLIDPLAFYVKNTANGAQKLIHLILDGSISPTLQFWISNAYQMLRSVAYSNNEIYLYWNDFISASQSKLSVYPLTGLPLTIPPNPRIIDTTTTTYICSKSLLFFSGVWGNSYHLLCTFNTITSSHASTLYTISNVAQVGSSAGPGITIPQKLVGMDYLIPVTATPDFAFMLYIGEGSDSTGLYGLQVSGVGAGTLQGPKNIIVQDLNVPTTTYTYRASPTVSPTYRNTDSGSNSTGAIIGVVIGVLVVVVITVCCYCKRSSDNNNEKKKHAVETTPNQVYNGRHNTTEMKGQETSHIVEPAVMPMTHVPGMNGPHQMNTAGQPHFAGAYPQMSGQSMYPMPQPAPTVISDAITITPAATTVLPFQSGQEQLQHLQFSSHPRPNFVTSVGDNGQSNSQQHEVNSGPISVVSASPNVSWSAPFSPGWEPQPWTPPMRPTSNNVNSSTLTERSLPSLPSHEASSGLMQGSPGTIGSNNPPYHGNV
ncbi:MAG: hypothetical protein J3Q66DRAFT_388899 [Benniella sp.]|nr:MAG: hypothetical protein J3Q66DRAFT_388899 [Benniella sp.]